MKGIKNQAANSEMSEYEKQIQQNIEERKKMFEEIIGDAKRDLMKENRKKNQDIPRPLKRKMDESIENPSISVMSLRIRKPKPELVLNKKIVKKIEIQLPKGKKKIIGLFTLADTKLKYKSIEDRKFFKEMIPLLEKESESEKLPDDPQDFLNVIKSFSIHEKGVAQVSKSRINCLAWHPSNCKLLVAVGDHDGNIGFWDVDNLEDNYHGVRTFNTVHKQSINCITFDTFNPMRLLSSSRDNSVQCLDLHSNVFYKIYWNSLKKSAICHHAQKNSSTLILSQSSGNVLVVDLRTVPYMVENTIQCFKNGTGTISLHPQDENLFMTCDRFGEIGVFDMRYTAANDFAVPVVSFPKAPKRVKGAFFSPITGQYALITCTDDTLKLYDVQKGKSKAECIKSIDHDNYTGSRVTPFKAVWHPQREDVFIVGSMEYPFRVELYGAPSGALLHNFNGDFLASETSINVFHPTVPIFAGSNSSGRVHIFRS